MNISEVVVLICVPKIQLFSLNSNEKQKKGFFKDKIKWRVRPLRAGEFRLSIFLIDLKR